MKGMKKSTIIIFAAIYIGLVFSCDVTNPIEDNSAFTRGAGVNDSTDNTKGGIQVDTVWEEPVTIGF